MSGFYMKRCTDKKDDSKLCHQISKAIMVVSAISTLAMGVSLTMRYKKKKSHDMMLEDPMME